MTARGADLEKRRYANSRDRELVYKLYGVTRQERNTIEKHSIPMVEKLGETRNALELLK